MNPSVDVGNPPRSIRHLRMAEHCTPDRIYESGPRSFSIGSKIGDHHHQLCRPACNSDARQNSCNSQEGNHKKLALRLPATFVREGNCYDGVKITEGQPPRLFSRAQRDFRSDYCIRANYPALRLSSRTSSSASARCCARCRYSDDPPSLFRLIR